MPVNGPATISRDLWQLPTAWMSLLPQHCNRLSAASAAEVCASHSWVRTLTMSLQGMHDKSHLNYAEFTNSRHTLCGRHFFYLGNEALDLDRCG
jgi:hypothetical protein